jgi:hypothetical protein
MNPVLQRFFILYRTMPEASLQDWKVALTEMSHVIEKLLQADVQQGDRATEPARRQSKAQTNHLTPEVNDRLSALSHDWLRGQFTMESLYSYLTETAGLIQRQLMEAEEAIRPGSHCSIIGHDLGTPRPANPETLPPQSIKGSA